MVDLTKKAISAVFRLDIDAKRLFPYTAAMSKTALLLLTLLFTALLASCGSSKQSSEELSSYTYSYSVNGCETGAQVADSQAGFCKNLTNHALNHYCAEQIRKVEFDRKCASLGIQWLE
jgi:hypothetical protein